MDNEIVHAIHVQWASSDCCGIWSCCVTRVGEHLQFIACMFRDVIVVMSAIMFSGVKD